MTVLPHFQLLLLPCLLLLLPYLLLLISSYLTSSYYSYYSNLQAQPKKVLLGRKACSSSDESPSFWPLLSNTNFAEHGYHYVVPGAKSQARATAAAALGGAAHQAAATAYQAERLAHPESGPDGAREASGASMAQSRTGASGLFQARVAAAAATGGVEYEAGAAHSALLPGTLPLPRCLRAYLLALCILLTYYQPLTNVRRPRDLPSGAEGAARPQRCRCPQEERRAPSSTSGLLRRLWDRSGVGTGGPGAAHAGASET